MMNEERWFSYPIWWTMAEYEHHQELLEYCLLRKAYDSGRILSNKGGWQSNDIDLNDENKVVNEFSIFLQKYLDLLGRRVNRKIKLGNLWININGYGTKNGEHVHPGSYVSGIFYVKTEDNQGSVYFSNPIKEFMLFTYPNDNFYQKEVCYKPENNKLILFPSFLSHFVSENNTNNDRISIAFNTKAVNE